MARLLDRLSASGPFWVVIASSLLAGYLLFGGFSETLPSAVAAGRVAVTVSMQQNPTESTAGDGRRYRDIGFGSRSGDEGRLEIPPAQALVKIEVRRLPGSVRRGAQSLVLPAGLTIASSEPGAQRLVAAHPAVVVLKSMQDTATIWMPVYCLDHGRQAPSLGAPVEFQFSSSETPQSKEIQKLSACLSERGMAYRAGQNAIWIVASKYLNESKRDLEQRLYQDARDTLFAIGEGQMTAEANRKLVEQKPNLSEDDRNHVASTFTQANFASIIDAKAKERARTDLEQFLQFGVPALQTCGYDVQATRLGGNY